MTHGRPDLVGRLWYWVALLASALLFALNGTAAKASSISDQGPVRQGFRSSTFVLPSPGTDCVRRCVGVGRVTLTKEHFEAAGSPAGSVAPLVREEVQRRADGLLQRFTETGAPALRTHVTQRPPNASGRHAPESETTHDYDAGSHVTTSLEFVATNSAPTSDVLLNSSKQLQAKFKHAGDFGVAGNYSKANAAKYSAALNQHITSASVTKISGTHRGNPVTHYLDPSTGLNVIVDPSGVFVSGWKLNPAQLQNVLKHGGL